MIFYIMGDINISGSLSENVKQIAQSVGSDFAENGRIVIYYDRRDSTTLLQLSANNLKDSESARLCGMARSTFRYRAEKFK